MICIYSQYVYMYACMQYIIYTYSNTSYMHMWFSMCVCIVSGRVDLAHNSPWSSDGSYPKSQPHPVSTRLWNPWQSCHPSIISKQYQTMVIYYTTAQWQDILAPHLLGKWFFCGHAVTLMRNVIIHDGAISLQNMAFSIIDAVKWNAWPKDGSFTIPNRYK